MEIKMGNMNKTVYGGIVAAMVIFAGSMLVGRLNNFEALTLLKAIFPSTRFLCSSIITATSTMLALLLTLLSFGNRTDKKLDTQHYERIKRIALLSCVAFSAAIIMLLIINLPLEESQESLQLWYKIIYYFILSYSALLGGLVITIILLLYQAAHDMILIFHPEADAAHMFRREEEE